MTLQNLQRRTLACRAAHELERMITSGEWPEGSRIPPESELMSRLGVSRNTVREAVRALSHLGLLEARAGDGTYVLSANLLAGSISRRLEGCSLIEALEAKECLERQAARLAARRRTEQDLVGLRGEQEALADAFAAGRATEDLTARIWRFEQRLARASGNQLLVELFESVAGPIRAAISTVVETARGVEADPEEPRQLNRRILTAIAEGDGDAADRLMLEKAEMVRSWLAIEEKNP